MLIQELAEKIFSGEKRSISRAISIVESDLPDAKDLLNKIQTKRGNAYRIGITGPPGAGKSTLTNHLTKYFRNQNKTVAIIAVDPTSPFTGGALLGDRVRMSEIGVDAGVFIRSMATRGSLGGLSKKTNDAADILDAAGFDFIIFETVGVGQSELDIANTADTTIVVLVPESGDSIQAMKAGLMEIADFFVLNKSDRPNADTAITALKTILSLKEYSKEDWHPNIFKSIASENLGISEIAEEILRHKSFLETKNLLNKKRKEHFKIRIKEITDAIIQEKLWTNERIIMLENSLSKVLEGKLSLVEVGNNIVTHFTKSIQTKEI